MKKCKEAIIDTQHFVYQAFLKLIYNELLFFDCLMYVEWLANA